MLYIKSAGGITDIYLELGTFVKSFYTIIQSPSSVKISLIGTSERRIHHSVLKENTYVKILREEVKK